MTDRSVLGASLDMIQAQALGLARDHLQPVPDIGLAQAEAGAALRRLRTRAKAEGFNLTVASGYRDYSRQLAIFNAKARAERPVHDDQGRALCRDDFDDRAWLHAILRFSALPGTSRHHWGTDFDLWDAAAVATDYVLSLSPEEYAPTGPFADFTAWLSERIDADDAEGFYRPYDRDRGGVAPEPWHVSFRPSAARMVEAVRTDALVDLWQCAEWTHAWLFEEPLALAECVVPDAEHLLARYVHLPD